MSKVTLKFLSEKCGVSTTIVSKILNKKEVRVSKEKKDLIEKMANDYCYTPNAAAVSLATKKTRMVGLLIPDISNTFFSEIAKNIESALSNSGYNVILCNTNDDYMLQEKYANLLLGRGVDALIFCLAMGTRNKCHFIKRFIDNNIPLVAFDRFIKSKEYSSVSIDNEKGMYQVTKHLIRLGHRQIGCIAGPKISNSSINRLKGFMHALTEEKIEINNDYIYYGDYRFESGYEGTKKILKNKNITSIVVFNDLMAYGCYKALDELGLRAGKDISVTGFDDLMFSSMLSVPLTTVKQNTLKISEEIAKLVLNNLADDSLLNIKKVDNVIIDPELVIRESTDKVI